MAIVPMSGPRRRVSLLQSKQALIGLLTVGVLAVIALLAPIIAPQGPNELVLDKLFAPPSADALLGRDHLGRDVLVRVIYGGRTSLEAALIAVAISMALGVPLGVIAGYYGGALNTVIMRFMDALMAFPTMLLAIAIAASLGPGLANAMIAIGIIGMPGTARLARSQVIQIKATEYTLAAILIGARDFRIMFRHILPNGLAPLIISATLSAAGAILTEAALSFVGLGVTPPTPSWGGMLNSAMPYLSEAPWLSIFPGLSIGIATMGFNFLGDGLRDLLDPRVRGR